MARGRAVRDADFIGKHRLRTLAIFAECAARAAGCSWPNGRHAVLARDEAFPRRPTGQRR